MSQDHFPATTRSPGTGLLENFLTLPDGRRIRTITGGSGPGPLVVFEAGMSAPAAEWVHTQREVAARARTLSYDRAGYGGSDDDPHDRTLERIVEDLSAVLDAVGETGPVVLAGHSWGGPIIRLFADRNPDRVAGLVFVDGSLAECFSVKLVKATARSFRAFSILSRFAGKRMLLRIALPHGSAPEISGADLEILLRDYACPRAMRTGARECAHLLAALPTIQQLQATGTPRVPTFYLQAGRVDRGMGTIRPLWNRVAEELVAATPQAKLVVVGEAGHLIPQEAPGPVREAIFDVLDRV
ncbi:MAG TPA: alpha/beta fold hydrolase [Amycolatopsis sp.]|nr:alpha/beta fold hydrolase [Amycolatopsis sp.]